MSDTPRTKEAARMGFIEGDMLRSVFVVPLKVAEELERELAQRTADFGNAIAERDVARWEIIEGLKEMYTTAGLRRELLRRGWWDWYKEVKP